MKTDRKKYIFIGIWLLALGVGLHYLWSYENRPGQTSGSSFLALPKELKTDAQRPTLVMFAHPHCPCSRASIAELSRLLSRFPDQFHTKIYFFRPHNKDLSWVQDDLWDKAENLKNTELFVDDEGQIAKSLKAKISGEVFVFSTARQTLYHGGLTPSRGHEGDSVGKMSLQEIARGQKPQVVETPVFGCSLYKEVVMSEGMPHRE